MSRPEAPVPDSPRRKFLRIAGRSIAVAGGAVILGGGVDAINNVIMTRRVTRDTKSYEEAKEQFEAMGLDKNRAILDVMSPYIGAFIITLGAIVAKMNKKAGSTNLD